MKSMKFSKAKCKVLPLAQGNLKYKYRLGGAWTESTPEEEVSRVLVDEKVGHKDDRGAETPLL